MMLIDDSDEWHPGLLPSVVEPVGPIQPEELHRHVKVLERIYISFLPPADTNSRTAQAKAIVAATAAFVEGCLDDIIRWRCGEFGIRRPNNLHSLAGMLNYCGNTLAPVRQGWPAESVESAQFVEGSDAWSLRKLRNAIDHGDLVNQSHLKMDSIEYFRRSACAYLEQVYISVGLGKPGWFE